MLYGLNGYTLQPLAGGLAEHTYLLRHPLREPRVVRVARPDTEETPVRPEVLIALEEKDFPAPRVIHALDGSAIVQHDGANVMLTTFVEGEIVESHANTPDSLRGLGRALGQLHAVPLPSATLPSSIFMPRTIIADALADLAAVERDVPLRWRMRLGELRTVLAATPSFEDLPTCLIHGDTHPGNAVRLADGTIVLIDWDCAGLGAAVLDLAFLAIATFTETADAPSVGSGYERVDAIVEGYREYRQPSAAELDALTAAIRYRVTYLNAASFAYLMRAGKFGSVEAAWWDGANAADEVSDLMRRGFDGRSED
jgi:Ser/Thr protein kinase RdoA (MazF antagonist)